MRIYYLLFFSLIIIFFSCKKTENVSSSFEALTANTTGVSFVNNVKNQKDFNVLSYRNFYNGGGVAIGDVNNDGLNDLYFSANRESNKLYINTGDFRFEENAQKAGVLGKKAWCTGVTMADVNADGWQDIYVCYSGDEKGSNKENELFINQKNGVFLEKAKDYGLNDAGLSTHASFFDFDMDGDLDCYVLNNSYKDPERIALYKRERMEIGAEGGDRLYRNDGIQETGNVKFTDVTATSGIFSSNIGFGLGISVADINADNWPDIYISNDFWERDYLYINNKNGTFSEQLTALMSYTSVSSMGSDIGDINNDGYMDIFTTDMLPPDNYRLKAATKFEDYYTEDIKFKNSYYHQFLQNCLQINRGDGHFQETAFMANVAATDWSWGALIFDMNMDGHKDIFVSNGVYQDITNADFVDFIADKDKVKAIVDEKGRYDFRDFEKYLPNNQRNNYAFINDGHATFFNQAKGMNLGEPSYSNGAAYGDLDNDGDMDLVVNNVNMEAFVYKNKAVESGQNFLKLKFEGTSLNKKAIGASVKIYSKGTVQIGTVMAARGFQSSVDTDICFGLGKTTTIDSAQITWPNGKMQTEKTLKINAVNLLKYSNTAKLEIQSIQNNYAFEDISSMVFLEKPTHIENQYNDFDRDRLMPHMLSNEGPKIIIGNINNDKQNDFLLLGAKGQSNQIFVNNNGKFKKLTPKDFDTINELDAVSGAIFDADADGDQDILIGFGGNEGQLNKDLYKVKYYLNDGKANFRREILTAPLAIGQINAIVPNDYDHDGDLDIFMGGGAIPGFYGLTPRSFMFQNNGTGGFTDVTTSQTGPIGMVKDAIWQDINNDSWADLIVVGEWMPISVFFNEGGELSSPKPLENSNGWWNTIKSADFDGDGDNDFIVGNWGLNIKLKASVQKPLGLYIGDLDEDKTPEAIMEWYTPEDEKPYPFASKVDLTAKMPFLKKQILKYSDYASKQVRDIFPSTDKAEKKIVNNFATSIIWNNGEKGFALEPFNTEAQMSPVFAIEVMDLDGDNKKDIYLGGNFYKLKPEIGMHDGFDGGYFKNLGNGRYQYITSLKSGIKIAGEVRDAKNINGTLLVARNNNSLLSFRKK